MAKMDKAFAYHDAVMRLLQRVRDEELPALEKAVDLCTEAIASDGLVHLFGSGHSSMMCEEMTPRQGTFVGWHTIKEQAVTHHTNIVGQNALRQVLHLEKTPGYAKSILDNFQFGPKDVMFIISTSGIRELIVEMALESRRRGLQVIALLSREHCRQARACHPSGKKLIDLADVVIDNKSPVGDCVTPVTGTSQRTGPVSTLTVAMAMNLIRAQVAEDLVQRGKPPILLPSHQFAEAGEVEAALERYYAAHARALARLLTGDRRY